ncbi:MAG TPA: hypothetical protein VJR27_04115 [Candidatus Saccharimonadales bacterium]|nr:hypothetical protein [Candidatus Saccharimonadales bacterium]
MIHPEFEKKNEQEPATPEALAELHKTVGRIMEEMPEGVAINENTEPSTFFGWKNNLPIFNAQPLVTHAIDGDFAIQFAPSAAETLKIGTDDMVEFVYAPPCYEVESPTEDAKPVDSYIGLTVSRPNSVVEADIYTIEVNSLNRDEVQSATHTYHTNLVLDNLERDELRSKATGQEELYKKMFNLSMQQEDERVEPIGKDDCAAFQKIIDQIDAL